MKKMYSFVLEHWILPQSNIKLLLISIYSSEFEWQYSFANIFQTFAHIYLILKVWRIL